MAAKDRIIVAVDVDTPEKAISIVEELQDQVGCFKIGLEFIYAMIEQLISPPEEGAIEKLRKIRHLFGLLQGCLFWDGKIHDIPNTASGVSKVIARLRPKMFNVHCSGGRAMMTAAKKSVEEILGQDHQSLVLGVTLLTSLTYDDLVELGIKKPINFADPEELKDAQNEEIFDFVVRHLAWLAQECSLDGVIASPQEIIGIREYCQPEFLVATPGVRPLWAAAGDQKRIMTPAEAIKAGANYLVIGRPITKPPAEIGTPVKAAERIAEEIDSVL